MRCFTRAQPRNVMQMKNERSGFLFSCPMCFCFWLGWTVQFTHFLDGLTTETKKTLNPLTLTRFLISTVEGKLSGYLPRHPWLTACINTLFVSLFEVTYRSKVLLKSDPVTTNWHGTGFRRDLVLAHHHTRWIWKGPGEEITRSGNWK